MVMVLSVLLYGCESWSLTLKQLTRLEVFHRGCLRQILGIRKADRISDAELYARCGTKVGEEVVPCENIATHWRRRVLRWLGHIGRMEDGRLPKQLLWATLPHGRRRPGRRTSALLPQTYHVHLGSLQRELASARQDFKTRVSQEDNSLYTKHNFSWLEACKDRNTWRRMIG